MRNPEKKKRQLFLFLLLLLSFGSFAQKTTVKVTDNSTSEPCLCANVVFYNLGNELIKGTITNKLGIAEFDLKEQAILVVSYVGYNSFTDTVSPGENIEIKLSPNNFEMDAIVVTGQYEPKPVDKSIYKIDVVSSETMQARGVNNLAEALSNETSVRLSTDPASGTTSIILQGMGDESVKYLIDGVPITGRIRGNLDLSQINMENVDHIEIVKGPMAVEYGTNAIAGVINIITKKNSYFNNSFKANSYIDTKGNYNFGIYGSIIRGKHTFTVSGNRNLFQGVDLDLVLDDEWIDIGHDRKMEFNPKRVYNADAEYAFKKKDLHISLKSQYMNSLIKENGNINPSSIAKDQDFYTTRILNSIIIKDKISKSVSYDIIGSYTYFGRQTDYIDANLDQLTKTITRQDTSVFHNLMSRGSLKYVPEKKNFSVMTGWDINYDEGYGDKIDNVNQLHFADSGASMGDYAFFVSGQYAPIEKLSLQPGLRYIYNTVYNSEPIPSMSVLYSFIENASIRISYAKGFRAPSLKELYMSFHDSNHDIEGNTNLKAETTNSYNASVNYKIIKIPFTLKFEPSVFFNDARNRIFVNIPDANTNYGFYENISKYRTFGGELNITYINRSGLNISGGFSRIGHAAADYDSLPFEPMVYYNNYSFNVKYTFKKMRTTLSTSLKYYGETPHITIDSDGGYYNVFTESYGDLEMSLIRNFFRNRLNVVIGGKNLLNYKGILTSGYENPEYDGYSPKSYGTSIYIKINLKFNS